MASTGQDLSRARWRKSTRSGSGNCLQAASVPGAIAVRDSAGPRGPVLAFTTRAWTAFTAALKTDPAQL